MYSMPEFFIPGEVPSSKNSKNFNIKMKRLFDSKPTRRYRKAAEPIYEELAPAFRRSRSHMPDPIKVHFTFIRGTRRRFDLINAAQIVQDLMVQYDWIADDNFTKLIPVFDPPEYDKAKPGVRIWVEGTGITKELAGLL